MTGRDHGGPSGGRARGSCLTKTPGTEGPGQMPEVGVCEPPAQSLVKQVITGLTAPEKGPRG